MPRYALVEFSTMLVMNVENRSSVLTAPTGFRNIVENLSNPALNEWTPGDDPQVGDVWDGAIPAGFAPPAPPEPEEIPSDLSAVSDRLTALQAEIDNIKAGVAAIAG